MKKKKPKTKKASKAVKKAEPKVFSDEVKKTKIRVVGVGGGGGTIVSEIAPRMQKASFVVANTDFQALKTASRKAAHFQFGQNLTKGLGTGMNSELGKIAAEGEKEKIKKFLEGQDLCIFVACLGGGTSSGSLPVFAKISKSIGNLNYGIFTLPFEFEGEKKMEMARESLKQVRPYFNAFSVIPNEGIFQIINKDTPLREALSAINKTLIESLEGLIETIYDPGLINIDFADFRTILQGHGRLAYLNSVEIQKKDNSIKDLVEKVLNCPLYPYNIRGAKGVLFNIFGEKDLSLAEVNQISKTIAGLASPQAKVIFGISQNKKNSERVRTTLLAIGCGMKLLPLKPKKELKKRKKRKKLKKKRKIKVSSKKRKTSPKPLPKVKKQKKQQKKRKKQKKTKSKTIKKEASSKKEEKVSSEDEKQLNGERVATTNFPTEKIRKNGIQIKKDTEKEEKEMWEKEKFWETPAFLRRKKII